MELIEKYFKDLSEEQIKQFNALPAFYKDWNAKINMISRKDMDEFPVRHLLHSLAIAAVQEFKPGDRVMDIGTGGGFPGIPLAIMFPEAEFTLVDSIGKKIKVINELVSVLGMKNVKAINARAEEITTKHDYITSRAVASSFKLVKYSLQASTPDTIHFILKGGDLLHERDELWKHYSTAKWTELSISEIFDEAFFETKKIIKIEGITA